MNRVVVTGLGIVSCIGNNQSDVLDSLINLRWDYDTVSLSKDLKSGKITDPFLYQIKVFELDDFPINEDTIWFFGKLNNGLLPFYLLLLNLDYSTFAF